MMEALDWQAIGVSVRLAFWTSAVLLLGGIPLSYWLATSKWRFKFLIEAIVAMPIVLPPTVLGFYLLYWIGPRGTLGQAYNWLTGTLLPFSFPGLLLGSVLYSLPFAVQPFLNGFLGLDRQWLEASWALGASHWQTLFRVVIPIIRPAILSGVLLSFAHTLGEFGVVLMVGGNIPGVTRTLSISIYDDVQSMNYSAAARTSGVLVGFSLLALFVLSALKKKS